MIINLIQESYIHFFSNRPIGQTLNISPKHFIILKTFNSEISYIEKWFTDQNTKALE